MPYRIEKRGSKFHVVNKATGEDKGASETEEMAKKHMAALYAHEPKDDIAERKDVTPKEGEHKYGEVEFADPKNKKYPIDTEEHIRSAWSYIHHPDNRAKYSAEDAGAITARIASAWRKKISKDGPPSARTDGDAESDPIDRWLNGDGKLDFAEDQPRDEDGKFASGGGGGGGEKGGKKAEEAYQRAKEAAKLYREASKLHAAAKTPETKAAKDRAHHLAEATKVAYWEVRGDHRTDTARRIDGVMRFDTGVLGKVEVTPEGWLRIPARIARTGIYEYINADGSLRRELRKPTDVFSPEAMASVALRPVTDDHPWAEVPPLLTPSNAKNYQRGSAGELVKRDGDYVATTLMITDADLIAKVKSGVQEVSAGYTADTIFEPGDWQGQHFDCYQENIRINHIAIVRQGRAGEDVRLKLDSGAAVSIRRISEEGPDSERPSIEEKRTMPQKKKIGGITFEVEEQLSEAIDKHIADLTAEHQVKVDKAARCDKCDSVMKCPKCDKARADAEKAAAEALSKEKGRADALQADLEKLTKAHADALAAVTDPKKVQEQVRTRVALETRATEILGGTSVKVDGKDVKLDALDDLAVKKAVIAKVYPQMKLDGKDQGYIDGVYDGALNEAGRIGLASARVLTGPVLDGAGAGGPIDLKAAKAKMEEEQRNAWKQTAGKTA